MPRHRKRHYEKNEFSISGASTRRSLMPIPLEAEFTDHSSDTNSCEGRSGFIVLDSYQFLNNMEESSSSTSPETHHGHHSPQAQRFHFGDPSSSPCGNGLDPPSIPGSPESEMEVPRGNWIGGGIESPIPPNMSYDTRSCYEAGNPADGVAVASRLPVTTSTTTRSFSVTSSASQSATEPSFISSLPSAVPNDVMEGRELSQRQLGGEENVAETDQNINETETCNEANADATLETSSCSQKEPEGALPAHRSFGSRRFDQLEDLLQEDVSAGVEMTSADTTTVRSTSASPPEGLKEIDISGVEDEGDSSEIENDLLQETPAVPATPAVAASSLVAPGTAVESTPATPQAPTKAKLTMPESDILRSPEEIIDDQDISLNIPYRADIQAPPTESDVSVFSVHSGYAIDPNTIPQIVPGTMVQGTTNMHPAQFTGIPSHIVPASIPNLQHQHSLGTNGSYHPYPTPPHTHPYPPAPAPMPQTVIMGTPSVGKRKIHFRLMEEVPVATSKRYSVRPSFLSFRRTSSRNLLTASPVAEEPPEHLDRGRVTVSWYEGTTTLELMEHVRNTVIRKLGLGGTTKLTDIRILDEGSNPPEEIVLTPYIPSGSRLLLRFSTKDAGGDRTPPHYHPSFTGAPESPSAAPSPFTTSSVDLQGLGLNANQLALLGARLKGLQVPTLPDQSTGDRGTEGSLPKPSLKKSARIIEPRRPKSDKSNGFKNVDSSPQRSLKQQDDDTNLKDDQSSVFEMQSLHPEDTIQKSLENITELLMRDRKRAAYAPRQDKRQAVFVLANYFVLFLSLIAISAEIQARAPGWNAAIEGHLNNVKNCSKDQEALFECVSNGDMAGLVASVVLWISRSAATKRIFLFGFDSPRKLWTVVYESLVTAVCWGFSYMFIRRGMNPDTNRNFLQKYWKDAVYGSLAGFNAAFMKHVLKNLIPQEAIEDALQERQLKILSWLPSFA